MRLPCALALLALSFSACTDSKPVPPKSAISPPQAQSAQGPTSQPRSDSSLVFDPVVRDLGTLEWPGRAQTTYRFRNAGSKPIEVLDMHASCGCTAMRMNITKDGAVVRSARGKGESLGPLLVVQPGEEGEIDVTFDSQGFGIEVKEKLSILTIVTSEPIKEPPRVFLNAKIDRAYQLHPAQVAFEPMSTKEEQSQTAEVLVVDPTLYPPFGSKLVSAPPGMKVQLEEVLKGGRAVILVHMTAGPGLKRPIFTGEVVIDADIAGPRTVKIPFGAQVTEDLSVVPGIFHFQVVEIDRPAEAIPVRVRFLDPGRSMTLSKATIEGDAADRLAVSVVPVAGKEGREFLMTLRAERGLPESGPNGLRGTVRIPTSIAEYPELRIEYRAVTRRLPQR